MTAAKVAVTIDADVLREIDALVARGEFPSRSNALQCAAKTLLAVRSRRHSLLGELAKLEVAEERALADETLAAEDAWPKY